MLGTREILAVTSGSNPSCLNSSITFTATAQNGGTSPIYQWKVNGNNAGTNSNVFTNTALTDGICNLKEVDKTND